MADIAEADRSLPGLGDNGLFDATALTDADPPTARTTRRAGTRSASRGAAATRRASTSDATDEKPSKWAGLFRRRRARTGSGSTFSSDNIGMHRLANLALVLGVLAGGVGSIDGLLNAAEIAFVEERRWVLPVAVDVFLVGSSIGTLIFRERRAWAAMVVSALATLGLVYFSAFVNFTYWQSATDPGTLAHEVGPYLKGAMPVLLLVAIEILAAINTTRRRVVPTSVTRLEHELSRLKGESRVRARIAKVKARDARRRAKREERAA